ncbi:MAG: LCP family protein [Oscillospiraceae bacterium]|nr:LCP family protein [Oscillospiraceae bacterium]
MKKNIVWIIISVFVLLLQAAAEAFTAVIVFRLDLLPEKYYALFGAVLLFPILVTALLLFVRGKRPVGKVRRIISCILALMVVGGCALLSKVATDIYTTLHAVTDVELNQTADEGEIYIFIRKDDTKTELSTMGNYRFSIVENYDVFYTEQVISRIQDKIQKYPILTKHEKFSDMVDALFSHKTDALIMNGAAVFMLMEEEGYEDFLQNARIMHTIPIDSLEQPEEPEEPETPEQPDIPKGPVNEAPFIVYISGSDSRSTTLKTKRSDVNIMVVVNPVTKQILLLNTPRDYYVPNPAGDGQLDKLTNCGVYGIKNSVKTLANFYGVDIAYYAQINFTGFEKLVDAVGGVTVYNDKAFSVGEHFFNEGEIELDGVRALAFARDRYHQSGGDRGRGKNQMKIITALIEKMTTGTTIISGYSEIMAGIKGMFRTSITTKEISTLVKMQLGDMASWNIQSFSVSGSGGSEPTYSAPGHKSYVMHPYLEEVAHAKYLIERVMVGHKLTDADMKAPK